MTNTKKVGSVVIGGVFAVAALASSASAQTIEQLQALIASLTTQISALSDTSATPTVNSGQYVHHPSIDYMFTTNLRKGSKGTAVKMLQTIINTGSDGVFGPGTERALKAWQSVNSLQADGKVGPATRAELNRKAAVTTATTATSTSPVAVSEISGDKLVVSSEISDETSVGPNQRVIFSKVTLSAGDEDVKVKDIFVEQTGNSNRAAFLEVLLLDSKKLEIDADSINSKDEGKLDADITIGAGKSTVVYIAGRMAAAENSNISNSDGLDIQIDVTSITVKGDDTEVEGDEFDGASHTINRNITAGTGVTIDVKLEDNTGSIGDEVEITEVVIDNNSNDDVILLSLKIERQGSIDSEGLEDVELKIDNKTYEADQDNRNDEEYTFIFGENGIVIKDDEDLEFIITAKITDDATNSETVRFSVTDSVLEFKDGEETTPVITNDNAKTSNVYNNTVEISDAEIQFGSSDEVESEDVAAGSENVEFSAFEFSLKGQDIEGDLEIVISVVKPTGTESADIELGNVAIYTEGGRRITDKEDSSNLDGNDITVNFDDIELANTDNEDVVYIVKGDINSDAPTGTTYKVTHYKLTSIETKGGNDIADTSKNDSSKAATQTVKGSEISVEIEDADDKSIPEGEDEIEIAVLEIDAKKSGKDVEFDRAVVTFTTSKTTPSGFRLDDEVTDCAFYKGNSKVSSVEDAGTNTRFNFDDILVKAGEKTELSLRCDISDEFVPDDTIVTTMTSFRAQSIDNDELDEDTITSSNTTTVKITVGEVTVNKTNDTENDAKTVVDGANDVVFAVYEYESEDADRTVEEVIFTFGSLVNDDNIDNFDLYVNGVIDSADADVTSTASATTVTFSDINFTAVQDAVVKLELRADVDLIGAETTAAEFITAISVEDNEVTTTQGENAGIVTIVPSVAVITQIDVNTSSLRAIAKDVKILAFKVEADGDDLNVQDVKFNISANGLTVSNVDLEVYDNSAGIGNPEATASNATPEIATTTGTGDYTIQVQRKIRDNDAYYFYVTAKISGVTDGDSVEVTLSKGDTAATSGITFSNDTDYTDVADRGGFSFMTDDFESLLYKD